MNIPRIQFHRDDFAASILHILNNAALDPNRLELDLNEDCILDNADRARMQIRELHSHGIRFALNDFGIGFLSLSSLRSFAFDRIKISRALMSTREGTGETATLLRSIIDLGRAQGLTVCAGAVETPAQWEMVKRFGIHEAQGSALSPALHVLEIAKICADDRRMPQVAPQPDEMPTKRRGPDRPTNPERLRKA